MSTPEKWSPDEKQLELLTVDELKFIFSEGKELLARTSIINNVVTTRTTMLLTLSLGIIVGLVAYVAKEWELTPQTVTSLVLVVYFMFPVYKLYHNIKGKSYGQTGSQPKQLWDEHFFRFTNENNRREKEFYKVVLKSYQEKIEMNMGNNAAKWKNYYSALWLLLISPLVTLASIVVAMAVCT